MILQDTSFRIPERFMIKAHLFNSDQRKLYELYFYLKNTFKISTNGRSPNNYALGMYW